MYAEFSYLYYPAIYHTSRRPCSVCVCGGVWFCSVCLFWFCTRATFDVGPTGLGQPVERCTFTIIIKENDDAE